uniref:Uncharacterized protein LOC102807600 n=1 Tax=Saccoglossus kowalevskii TaxID=10224 RepID=A0ABM0MYX1_SACKO|nr:PREDICTED: uncharacterized protein LOC102807600 [Saccoglossus kowalevskii]
MTASWMQSFNIHKDTTPTTLPTAFGEIIENTTLHSSLDEKMIESWLRQITQLSPVKRTPHYSPGIGQANKIHGSRLHKAKDDGKEMTENQQPHSNSSQQTGNLTCQIKVCKDATPPTQQSFSATARSFGRTIDINTTSPHRKNFSVTTLCTGSSKNGRQVDNIPGIVDCGEKIPQVTLPPTKQLLPDKICGEEIPQVVLPPTKQLLPDDTYTFVVFNYKTTLANINCRTGRKTNVSSGAELRHKTFHVAKTRTTVPCISMSSVRAAVERRWSR